MLIYTVWSQIKKSFLQTNTPKCQPPKQKPLNKTKSTKPKKEKRKKVSGDGRKRLLLRSETVSESETNKAKWVSRLVSTNTTF